MKSSRIQFAIFISWLLLLWGGVPNAVWLMPAQAAPACFQVSSARGRIMRQVNGRSYPAGRVQVRLKRVGGNDAGQTAFTASDGMYSFRNMSPGNYVVEVVVGNPQRVIKNLSVQIPRDAIVDIPQIVL